MKKTKEERNAELIAKSKEIKEKHTSFWHEFKQFISRGNVFDMAVGIVVGGAFTQIVNSLVNNILNPVVGLATNGIDFGSLKVVLKASEEGKNELSLSYGAFINSIINFLIVSLVIFCLLRSFNSLKKKADTKKALEKKKAEEEALKEIISTEEVKESSEIAILKEIRDLLKKDK